MTTKQTALEHKAADKAAGRDWECCCSACHLERQEELKMELRRSGGLWTATAELLNRQIDTSELGTCITAFCGGPTEPQHSYCSNCEDAIRAGQFRARKEHLRNDSE